MNWNWFNIHCKQRLKSLKFMYINSRVKIWHMYPYLSNNNVWNDAWLVFHLAMKERPCHFGFVFNFHSLQFWNIHSLFSNGRWQALWPRTNLACSPRVLCGSSIRGIVSCFFTSSTERAWKFSSLALPLTTDTDCKT